MYINQHNLIMNVQKRSVDIVMITLASSSLTFHSFEQQISLLSLRTEEFTVHRGKTTNVVCFVLQTQHQVPVLGTGQRQWDCRAQSTRACTTGTRTECNTGMDTERQWAIRGDCSSG